MVKWRGTRTPVDTKKKKEKKIKYIRVMKNREREGKLDMRGKMERVQWSETRRGGKARRGD